MSIAIVCPHCTQSLKVPDRLAGGKGKCPKCGNILHIPATKSPEAEEAPARPAARKPRPSQAAIQEEKVVRTRQRAAEQDREDEDRESAEQDEAPAKVTRKKKKRKKSRAMLFGLLGGGCFALLLACTGIGGLSWWFFFRSSINDDLEFMPSNCQVVISVQLDELTKSEVFKELRREVPEIDQGMNNSGNQGIGLQPDEVEWMVIGAGSDFARSGITIVMHTKKNIDTNDLRTRFKNATYKEVKAGKYTMQEPQDMTNPAFCVLDKRRVLLGDREGVRGVLARGKKPDFSKSMEAALKQADFKKTIALAIDAKAGRTAGGGGLAAMGGQDFLSTLEKTNGVVVQAKIAADVRFEMILLCQDAASANDVKKLLDGFLVMGKNNKALPQELRDLMELNLKVDGNKVTGNNTFKVGPLIKTFKQKRGMF